MIPVLGLKNYTQLSYLNMGYNSITDIPEGIFAVDSWGSNLQTILLRNNKITHLHLGSFAGLEQIQEISLSFNDITIHHPLVFENVSRTLKILELSFAVFPARSLESLDPLDALLPLSQLIWLGLDNNNLKQVSNESFAQMRELSYINLSFNQLKTLPRGLFQSDAHSHLVEIDLSYNGLERLEAQTFHSLGDLQTLNLQSNRLRTIARHAFHNLEFLRYLDLSYNRLVNISHGAFTVLPNLAALDLMHNQLCSLSLKSFLCVKSIDKRDGAGSHNWGSVKEAIDDVNKNESETNVTNAEGGAKADESGTEPQTEQATAEEEAKELTLDEWKAQQGQRIKPTFNIRKAGEGEDTTQWKKMVVLTSNKKKENDSEEELEYDPALYPQRVGRQQRVLDIQFNFNDGRRGGPGGFGGRGGRGGPRPGGFGGGPRSEGGNRDGGNREGGRDNREGGNRGPRDGQQHNNEGGASSAQNQRPPIDRRGPGNNQNNNQNSGPGPNKRFERQQNTAPKVNDERQFPTLA
ncbi:GD21970 [Drosophila simulans]|uniref:GD21970 n=1 Tax=Drosophila simulans TaxID=7240 RepID=B4Q5Z7_DROSI|nr:GD21970 [Drosophila simulans]